MRSFVISARLLGLAASASIGIAACSAPSTVPSMPGSPPLPATASAPAAIAGNHLAPAGGDRIAPSNRIVQPSVLNTPARLYVAGLSANAVFAYNQGEKSPANPRYKITSGISDPNGLATDASGNLYVTNELSNAVAVYPPGKRTPSETITSGLNTPFAVAIDGTGDIYVANDPAGQTAYINLYVAGSTSPSYTWYAPVSNPTITGLKFYGQNSSAGRLYAVYYWFDSYGNPHGDMMQCIQGYSTCFTQGFTFGRTGGLSAPSPQTGSFLVADQTAPGLWILGESSVRLFKTPYVPWYMALNQKHTRIFVSDGGSEVHEYTYPGMKQTKTFVASGGYEGPFVTGVATSPSGDV